jgi:hypothetical protein
MVRALRWKEPHFMVSALSGKGCQEVCRAAARFLAAERSRAAKEGA